MFGTLGASVAGGTSFRISPSKVTPGSTGAVAALKARLLGTVSYSKLSGAASVSVASDGTVSLSSGLADGATATFVARAQNTAGDAVEKSFTLTGQAVLTVPDAPTIGTVTPGDTTNSVAYTAPASNGGSAITSYKIERKAGAGSYSTIAATYTGGSPFVDTGLTNGTSYTYRISATNAIGTGAASGEASGTPASGGGYTPVTGDPLSFAVSGASVIDPNGSGYGVFGNGWTATVVFKGLSPNANVDIFDGQKVTLSVTDPGYTTSGTTTTVNRTVKGSITLRKAYSNNQARQIATVGSDLQLIICLEDVIYQGTTINSVTFDATAYPGSNALVLTGASVTNSSTLAYPKPYFAWLNRQFERESTSSFHVECVAYHRHGMNGQMVACVEFTGKDASGNSAAVQRTSAPALSTIQTRGNIVESWQASIPLTALTQTTTTRSKVHAKVYPWIGDSTAILDTEVSGAAVPSYDTWVSLEFVNDKNGTYGGAYAYVKAGASGGTVSATAATARAAPYPDWASAYAALKVWNNANRGHNDHSGSTIRLMDDGAGGPVTHNFGAISTTAGLCWTTTEADPLNTAAVQLQTNYTFGPSTVPDMTAIGAGITVYNTSYTLTGSGGSALGGSTTINLSIDGCVMDMSVAGSASGANYLRATYIWSRNVNWLSPGSHGKTVTNANSNQAFVLMFGNTAVGGILFDQQFCTIGNVVTSCQLGGDPGGTLTATYSADGKIYANNSIFKATTSAYSTGFMMSTTGTNYARGMAVVQNMIELLSNASLTITFSMSSDSKINRVGDGLFAYNTVLGNRGNRLYNDVVGAAGYQKRAVSRFELLYSMPTKEDTFIQDSGCVGNFEWAYKVGSLGTVNLCGAATEGGTVLQSGVDPSAGTTGGVNNSKWSGMYVPTNWYVGNGATGYATVTYVDDKCLMVGTGVGGGDYHLSGGSNGAYDRVPSGLAMLKYDLGGATRLNNGSGAAGAYER